MIRLTKVDGSAIVVNADEIEFVEPLHDSIVSLRSGKKIIVKEKSEAIVQLVIDYKRSCQQQA